MFMAMGMTYDEYWNGENDAPKYYLESEKMRTYKQNEWLWLQGRYVYDAVGALIPAFKFGVKHPKAEPYLEEPYALTSEEIEVRKEKHYKAMLSKMKVKAEQSKDGRDR